MKKLYLLSAMLLIALLSGCTRIMYEGPKLPGSQVSKISSANVIVTSIDGEKVPYSGGNFASFVVKPGEHVLGLYLNSSPMVSKESFTIFVSEPGKTYKLKGVFKKYWSANPTWELQIIDEETGKNVAVQEDNADRGV